MPLNVSLISQLMTRLIQEHADEVIGGCQILMHILSPDEVLIGIEDIQNLKLLRALKQAALSSTHKMKNVFLFRVIPTKYPSWRR